MTTTATVTFHRTGIPGMWDFRIDGIDAGTLMRGERSRLWTCDAAYDCRYEVGSRWAYWETLADARESIRRWVAKGPGYSV